MDLTHLFPQRALRKSGEVWGAPERSGEVWGGLDRSGEVWGGLGSSREVWGATGSYGELRRGLEVWGAYRALTGPGPGSHSKTSGFGCPKPEKPDKSEI